MTYPSQAHYYLIGKETTWGTAVTADKDVGIVTDISDNLTREVIQNQGISSLETQNVTDGVVDIAQVLTLDFQHGRLCEYIFGTVGHAETSGDWKHTFTVNNVAPSLTGESGDNLAVDAVLASAGMLVDNAEFTVGLNQSLQLKVDMKD